MKDAKFDERTARWIYKWLGQEVPLDMNAFWGLCVPKLKDDEDVEMAVAFRNGNKYSALIVVSTPLDLGRWDEPPEDFVHEGDADTPEAAVFGALASYLSYTTMLPFEDDEE